MLLFSPWLCTFSWKNEAPASGNRFDPFQTSALCLSVVGLQATRLGTYIEDRVNKYLKRQNHPEAGEVFVRVVASSDKTVEIKPGMKAR